MTHSTKSSQALVDPLYRAYENLDDRRRRSFYFLVTFTVVFGLLLALQENEFALPGFQISVSVDVAVAIGPAFLIIASLSFLYLSSHTVMAGITYLEHFVSANPSVLEGRDMVEVHAMIKRRDVTERINPYLLFRPTHDSWDRMIPKPLLWSIHIVNVVVVIAAILIPMALYGLLVYQILLRDVFAKIPMVGWALVSYYLLLSIGFIIAPAYFYYRAKTAREKFRVFYPIV